MKCCDLTSGKLKHRINIQRETKTSDGAGGASITWNTIAQPWAYIKPRSGNERFQAMRLESDITHRIYMRYRTDFNAADRIEYNGRIMQIRAIVNIEELNDWLELYVDEGPAT